MARVIVCQGQGCGHHNPISPGSVPLTCSSCQGSLLGQVPVDPEEIGVQVTASTVGQASRACPRCRGSNPRDATACVFCGAPMSHDAEPQHAEPQSPLPVDLARRFDVIEALPAHSAEADLFIVQPRSGGPTKFLKLYRQGLSPDREVLKRLQAASADHVAHLDEFGEVAHSGALRFFEVQELLPLGSLRADLNDRGQWHAQMVEDLVREMAEALVHLEVSGLRHGDVKPENIMFRSKAPMDLVLTDFGGVQISDASVHVGQHGVFSIDYVAPEAAVGSKGDGRALHRKSDYFSLGVIVAECLLGRHPVRLESVHARSAVLVKEGAPTEELPERFALLVKGLTAIDPAVRFGKPEVDRWLARDPTLLAPKLPQPSDTKPYTFNKKPYYNLDALSDAMHDAPAVGALWIEQGLLDKGLADHFKDHDRAFSVANIAKEQSSGQLALMYCLQVLSPREYPRLLGVELTHGNLVVASAQAAQGDEAARRLVDLLWNEQILVHFPERADPPIKDPDAYAGIDAAWRKHLDAFEAAATDANNRVRPEDRLSTQAPRELRYPALGWAANPQLCTQAAAELTAQLGEVRRPPWFASAVTASADRPGALVAMSTFVAAVRRITSELEANAKSRSTKDIGLKPLSSENSRSFPTWMGGVLFVGLVLGALYLHWSIFLSTFEKGGADRRTPRVGNSSEPSAPSGAKEDAGTAGSDSAMRSRFNFQAWPVGRQLKFVGNTGFVLCTRPCSTYSHGVTIRLAYIEKSSEKYINLTFEAVAGSKIVREGFLSDNGRITEDYLLFVYGDAPHGDVKDSFYARSIHLLDEKGRKYEATNGVQGLQIKRWNRSAYAAALPFNSTNEFYVTFPIPAEGTQSLKFIYPQLSGHQTAWYWNVF